MPDRDLTNVQFPMLNSYPMRIAHWELNIGQILGMMPALDTSKLFLREP